MFDCVCRWLMVMANSNDYKEIGLNSDKNKNVAESSPSSDFDRLEDCNEAEFRGATLSLAPETSSPPEPNVASGGGESPKMKLNSSTISGNNLIVR